MAITITALIVSRILTSSFQSWWVRLFHLLEVGGKRGGCQRVESGRFLPFCPLKICFSHLMCLDISNPSKFGTEPKSFAPLSSSCRRWTTSGRVSFQKTRAFLRLWQKDTARISTHGHLLFAGICILRGNKIGRELFLSWCMVPKDTHRLTKRQQKAEIQNTKTEFHLTIEM